MFVFVESNVNEAWFPSCVVYVNKEISGFPVNELQKLTEIVQARMLQN